MADYSDADFMLEQQRAVERMREMSGRAQPAGAPHPMPPVPPFVRLPNGAADRQRQDGDYPARQNTDGMPRRAGPTGQPRHGAGQPQYGSGQPQRGSGHPQQNPPPAGGLGLPFLDRLKTDSDLALILGILLILWSEDADRRLLLALLYILF